MIESLFAFFSQLPPIGVWCGGVVVEMEVAEVEEVGEADVAHAVKHGRLDVGKTCLEILEKLSDEGTVARLLKLMLVGTGLDARIVGNERKLVDAALRNQT